MAANTLDLHVLWSRVVSGRLRSRLADQGGLHFERQIGFFMERLLRRIGQAFGPDVEATCPEQRIGDGGNLPGAPDPFALVEALVVDVVLGEVAFLPVATAVGDIVTTPDDESADPVATFAGNAAGAELQAQFHEVPAGNRLLQEEP